METLRDVLIDTSLIYGNLVLKNVTFASTTSILLCLSLTAKWSKLLPNAYIPSAEYGNSSRSNLRTSTVFEEAAA
jgi:hypothetical protein